MANGRLPAPPHDASGHTWHHSDAVLFGITKHGLGPYAPAGYESDMPAFADVLSDDQIAAALAYIKSRWPAEIRARQAQVNQQAGQP
jgi:mono/diheme cytochrome c family protein